MKLNTVSDKRIFGISDAFKKAMWNNSNLLILETTNNSISGAFSERSGGEKELEEIEQILIAEKFKLSLFLFDDKWLMISTY